MGWKEYWNSFNAIHSTLAEKFNTFDIPDNTYNWFLNYFSGRGHVTRFAGETSGITRITASVIQLRASCRASIFYYLLIRAAPNAWT